MPSRCTLLTLALASIWTPLLPAAEPQTLDELERLVQQGPKLYLPKLITLYEAKVERIYEAKLKDATPEYREALRAAQEAWRKFDAADRIVGAMDTEGGSGQAVFAMQRRVYQLRLRCYQLSTDYFQGWVEIPKVPEPPAAK